MIIKLNDIIQVLSKQNAALNVEVIALQLAVQALEDQLADVPRESDDTKAENPEEDPEN